MIKKILSLFIISLFLPWASQAQTVSPGTLIQASGTTAVYYLSSDNKRYVFPNEKTFKTWYADFSKVQVITLAQLQFYPIGGNATYRPGTRLVKITTDPKTYAVEPGGILRWITSEDVAKGLYGANWASLIDDVPDPFFVNYLVDEARPVDTLSHPLGTLFTESETGKIYRISKAADEIVKRQVINLSDNNFRQEFLVNSSIAVSYPDGEPIDSLESELISLIKESDSLPPEEAIEPEQPPLVGNAIFADNRAEVSGDGSLDNPYKTINEGLAALTSGQTLYIRGTTDESGLIYKEQLSFSGSGSANTPKIVRVYPGENVSISHPGTLGLNNSWWELHGLSLNHQNSDSQLINISGRNLILEDLQLSQGAGAAVWLAAGAGNITIQNSEISDFSDDCVHIRSKVSQVTVSGTTFKNCGSDGVEIYGEGSTKLEDFGTGLVIKNNTIVGSAQSQSGLNIKSGLGTLIANNIISGLSNGSAIEVHFEPHHTLIDSNQIFTSQRAVYAHSNFGKTPNGVDLFNNIFYDLKQEALYLDGVASLRAVHNTLVNITGPAFRVGNAGISSGQIRNNLISRGGSNQIDPLAQKAVVSHNGWFDGAQPGALTGSQAIEGGSAGFIDAVSHNYQLRTESMAVDTGISLDYIMTDAAGNKREAGTASDLGAYEAQ